MPSDPPSPPSEEQSRLRRWGATLLRVAFDVVKQPVLKIALLIPLAVIGAVAWSWFVQLEALTFPSTPGEITGNEWAAQEHEQKLEYAYSVGGAAFRGSGLRRDGIWLGPADEERARNYPVGKRVEVYYKPSDPQVSLLEPGLTLQHVLLLTPMAVLLGVIVIALVAPHWLLRRLLRPLGFRFPGDAPPGPRSRRRPRPSSTGAWGKPQPPSDL